MSSRVRKKLRLGDLQEDTIIPRDESQDVEAKPLDPELAFLIQGNSADRVEATLKDMRSKKMRKYDKMPEKEIIYEDW